MPESIMDAVRKLRRRFGAPPRAWSGATLAEMPVGSGGYLEDGQISVDTDGVPVTGTAMKVEARTGYAPYPVEWVYVERTSESTYALTVREGSTFRRNAEPPAELFSKEPFRRGEAASGAEVSFEALFEAPLLHHPHHERRPIAELRAREHLPGD